MKITVFKSGAIAYMLLGIMHVLSHFRGTDFDPQVTNTLIVMKNTIIRMMGEHTLLQFYDGFSLTTGFLLFAFGLQAYMITRPNKQVIIVNICISLVIFVLTIKYFHILASAFIAIALTCFILSLIRKEQDKSLFVIKKQQE